jgi:hypothetical protein
VPEGAVRALRSIHAALRLGGVLLDVQPARHDSWVEIQHGDRTLRVAELDESPGYAAQRAALGALRTVVDEKLFAPEADLFFTYRYHFDGFDAWIEQMNGWERIVMSPELRERVREALAAAPGKLSVARNMHTARFRRL